MKKLLLGFAISIATFAYSTTGYAGPGPVYPLDAIEFDGLHSGNALIGTTCADGPSNACVVVTGGVQDVTALINSFIPEGGICCGSSGISVQINEATTGDDVEVADDYYGPFSGSLSSSDSGSADKLNWYSAVYGSPFSIDFTNGDGVITDVLFNVGAAPSRAVPEPAGLTLLGAGLVSVGLIRRRTVRRDR